MIAKWFPASPLALLVCGLLVLSVSPMIADDEETVTLSGEIEVAGYDQDGNVESVAIYDGDWGSVLIAKQGKGRELFDHVGAVVRVTGKIVELDDDSGYLYSITVSGYTIEQPAELDDLPDWEPDN